jgi:hypothetical protein
MLGLGSATRIFVATGKTDMRLGINGLYALVVGKLQQNLKVVTCFYSQIREEIA